MLVGKLFAPKWKHRNAEVRKQALLDLNLGSKGSVPIIIEMARADLDIEIRKLALKRIDDISFLLELAASQGEELSENINRRLGQLLSNSTIKQNHVAAIDAHLRQFADPKLLQLVLEKSQQESLRETALLALDKNSTYADTAMYDKSATLRLLAIERISKVSTIERVLKHSKTKDKSVYQIAKQKLDANQSQKNKPNQRQLHVLMDQLLVELNAIVKVCQEQQRWAPQQAQFAALQKDWQLLIEQAVSGSTNSTTLITDNKTQFELLNNKFKQGFEQEKELLKQRELEIEDFEPIKDIIHEYCNKLQELTTELETVSDSDLLQTLSSQAKKIDSGWNQIHSDLPTIVDTNYMQDVLDLYKSHWRSYQQCVLFAETNLRNVKLRKRYLVEIQTQLESSDTITDKKIAQYKKYLKYFEVTASTSSSLASADSNTNADHNPPDGTKNIRNQFKQLLQQLEEKLSQQSVKSSNCLDELKKVVSDLDGALNNGKAKFAVNLTRRWDKLVVDLDGATRHSKKYNSLLSQYKKLQPKVSELREWREWSNLPVKEKLCQDIELLADDAANAADNSQFNFSAAMEQLKAYRRDWNKLIDSEFKSDKNLEKKFNASCDIISRASQSFFNDLSQGRQSNLQKRQQYCADLDAYSEKLNTVEITEIDAKHLDKVIRVSNKEWYSLGAVDRTKKEAINKQFSEAISKLADIRHTLRENNSEAKNTLLQRVSKVLKDIETDTKNISSSIDAIKRCQSQWKNIGVAVKDRELWQQFQQTCNKVFEHRQQQNSEMATQRNQQRQELHTLCSTIESISIDANNSIAKARQQFSELKTQWTEQAAEVEDKAIARHFKTACQEFEKKISLHQQEAKKENHAARLKLWDICIELESLLAAGLQTVPPSTLTKEFEQIQERYNLLTTTTGTYTKSLQIRYQKLTQLMSELVPHAAATDSGSEAKTLSIDESLLAIESRKKMCLHAEILASIESPTDEIDARMSLQVSMLANRMTQGGRSDVSSVEEIIKLVDAWHRSAIVIDPIRVMLEKRFSNAIQTMDN